MLSQLKRSSFLFTIMLLAVLSVQASSTSLMEASVENPLLPTTRHVVHQALVTDSIGLGRLCSFQIGNKVPVINVYLPDREEYYFVRCSKTELTTLLPVEMKLAYFKSCMKIEERYAGSRESAFGELLAKIILPQKKYPGKVLVDEYQLGIPMEWVVDNVTDLKRTISYLSAALEQLAVKPMALPLLLVINSQQDLHSLTDAECNFLATYFDLVPHTDPRVKSFFHATRKRMMSQCSKFESGRPYLIQNNGLIAAAYGAIEKEFKRFDCRQIVPVIAATTVTMIIMEIYRPWMNHALRNMGLLPPPAGNGRPAARPASPVATPPAQP